MVGCAVCKFLVLYVFSPTHFNIFFGSLSPHPATISATRPLRIEPSARLELHVLRCVSVNVELRQETGERVRMYYRSALSFGLEQAEQKKKEKKKSVKIKSA